MQELQPLAYSLCQIIHYTLHLRLIRSLIDLGGGVTKLLMTIPMLMLLDVLKDIR